MFSSARSQTSSFFFSFLLLVVVWYIPSFLGQSGGSPSRNCALLSGVAPLRLGSRWSGSLHTLSLPHPTPWRPGKRDHQRRGRRGSLSRPSGLHSYKGTSHGYSWYSGDQAAMLSWMSNESVIVNVFAVSGHRSGGPMKTTSLVPPCWLPCCTDVSAAVVGLPRAVKR